MLAKVNVDDDHVALQVQDNITLMHGMYHRMNSVMSTSANSHTHTNLFLREAN